MVTTNVVCIPSVVDSLVLGPLDRLHDEPSVADVQIGDGPRERQKGASRAERRPNFRIPAILTGRPGVFEV